MRFTALADLLGGLSYNRRMILPDELKLDLPMTIAGGVVTTTMKVWEILVASRDGRLETVKRIVEECPEMAYAQYNYTPPPVNAGHLGREKSQSRRCRNAQEQRAIPVVQALKMGTRSAID